MANSEDPDYTAPSDLGLLCLHMSFCQETLVCKILEHLLCLLYPKHSNKTYQL